jgi:hypothetical protein
MVSCGRQSYIAKLKQPEEVKGCTRDEDGMIAADVSQNGLKSVDHTFAEQLDRVGVP